MEGPRLPSSALDDDDKPDDPPIWHKPISSLPNLSSVGSIDQSPGHWRKHSLNFSPSVPPPPDPTPEVETYVIQLPKDQIYWVPPPEHARIVAQYQDPVKKDKPVCSNRLVWFFVVLVILGILAGAITLIFHSVFNPVPPVFNVEKFAVNSPKSPSKSFEITLKADNPTSNMGINYVQEESKSVSLTYKNKNLGQGKLPKLSQVAGGSDKVRLKLNGSKNMALPGSKQPVNMVVKMNLRAEFHAGPVKKNKIVAVTCEIKVKGLEAKKVEILSEDCESEFRN